jgi:hypothetical protein
MLDTLLELPFALNRHRDAPLLDERLAFLRYLQERGTSRDRAAGSLHRSPPLLTTCARWGFQVKRSFDANKP